MRILHVTPCYEDAWGYGGIPRVVSALARAQVRAGHAVTVCTTDAGLAAPRGDRGGVEVVAFHNLSERAAFRLQLYLPLAMRGWLRENARRFEVVHAHGHRNLPELWAQRACERAPVPFLLSPHGTAPRIERRRAAKRLADVLALDRVLRGAARVLCVSRAEERGLLAQGVAQEKMRVVGNPVEPPAGPVSGNAFRERYGLTAAPMIAYLGRITPRKEVHTLLAAFASLPDVRARLALAGDDVAASLPEIGSRVLRLPALRDAERFELLAAADVVAYPGRDEVFGLVAFEALLCGTPVVVAGDSGCGELVGELGGGLSVAPGDAAQLSAALARVLSSAEEFRQKALDAGARVRSRFSPDAVSERICAAYAELLSGAPRVQRPL